MKCEKTKSIHFRRLNGVRALAALGVFYNL
jgi:hypothetical protein